MDSDWTIDSIHSLMPKCSLTAFSNKLLAVHWLRVFPPVQGSTLHSQGPGKRPHPHLPASSFASLQYILQVAARVSFKKNVMKNITCTKRIHFTVNIHKPNPKFNHEHFTNFITDLSLHPSLNPSYFLMHLKLVVDISTLPLNILACIQNRFVFKWKADHLILLLIMLGIKSQPLPWSTRSCGIQLFLPLQPNSLLSFPCSLSSTHSGYLSAPQTWQELPCLRGFALAAPAMFSP